MNDLLPNPPEQLKQKKKSRSKALTNINSFFKKHNLMLQNLFNIGMLVLAIFAICFSIRSYRNANNQFKDNAEKSDSLFEVQLKNGRMINTNLEKMREQSDSLYKIQFELTNTQIDIIKRQLKDQINSGSPKIIVALATLEDKSTLIEGKYSPIIEIAIRNTGKRDAGDIMFRAFTITDDFKYIRSDIGYTGSNYSLGPEQESIFKFLPNFDKPITNFYFCYEVSYVDKSTNTKTYYTIFNYLENIRGQDLFANCNNQTATKLRKLINYVIAKAHQGILH
jgi:hypothetical protein